MPFTRAMSVSGRVSLSASGYFLKGYAAAQAEPITDLMHDPRVSDDAIKEAYFALLAEEGVV